MAGQVGISGGWDFSGGQGGPVAPGSGNPPVPPTGTFSNSTGTFAPIDGNYQLWSADSRLTSGQVFPGIFIVGTSAPSDTRYGWAKIDSSTPPNFLGWYAYISGIGWQQFGQQGATGAMGAAGAGVSCLLNSDLTAGANGATGIYANPSTPTSFPAGEYVLVNDNTVSTAALYLITAMDATQETNPSSGPSLAAASGAGPGAGTWYIAGALRNAVGTTLVSTAVSISIASGQYIQATFSTPPAGYTWDVYASQTVGSMTLLYSQNLGTGGTVANITAAGSANAVPSANTTQGVLMTRQAWVNSTAGAGYVFAVANSAAMMITGVPGATGSAGSATRSTLISNGGAGFVAGGFNTSQTVPVTASTGTIFETNDIVVVTDGTANAYYKPPAPGSANSVTGTRLDVPSDLAQAGAGYTFADGSLVYWAGQIGPPGDAGAAGAVFSALSTTFTAGAQNATGLTCTVSNPAPFVVGGFVQGSDNFGVGAWYQVANVSGNTITLTRLAVNPPGVAVAGDTYVFDPANGATLSISGPPGVITAGGSSSLAAAGNQLAQWAFCN